MAEGSRLRALWRLQAFAVGSWLVVASGLPAVLSPLPRRWRRTAPYIARWARLGARCLGIRVSPVGALPPPGSLVVANHQGYADVVTIGGLYPSIFVARHDMRAWPLFGALAASGATIFINRQVRRAGVRGRAQVTRALGVGATVTAFPEGTSHGGETLLPFRTGIFQAAVEAGVPVVPAAISYLALDGRAIDDTTLEVVGWFRNEPFLQHVVRLGGHREVVAEVAFGEAVPSVGATRRELAAAARERVGELLVATRQRSGAGAADAAPGWESA